MAATSLTIFTPASSSSSSSLLPSNDSFFSHTSSLNFQSPKPKPIRSLKFKSQNSTLSLLFHLHICHSISDELQPNPDEQEQEEEEDDEIDEENKGLDLADDCRLYVGNLPYSMTSSQLAEIFAEAGQIRSVEIVYDKVTDRSRGFGFVTMSTIDEAKEGIRMFDGSQIGGRTVKVNFPEVPRGGERKEMEPKIIRGNQSFVDSPHKIYVGNLGWGITTQKLRDAFVDRPGYLSARVIYERETRRSRGFGFVSFETANDAQSALDAMNGVELEGRPLRLNMATERTRSSTEVYA